MLEVWTETFSALDAPDRNAVNSLPPANTAEDIGEWVDIPFGEEAPTMPVDGEDTDDSGDDDVEKASNRYGTYIQTLNGTGYVTNIKHDWKQ